MGIIFTLESETLEIVQDALDDLITEFGKNCLLVYPARMVACASCAANPGAGDGLSGGAPSNRWRTGTPVGPSPVCPACSGAGAIAQEVTETIKLGCTYKPLGFFHGVPNVDVRIRNAKLQTKCYLADAPKLSRCDHLIYQVEQAGVMRARFKLASDPVDVSNIVKGRYAVAYWDQVSA